MKMLKTTTLLFFIYILGFGFVSCDFLEPEDTETHQSTSINYMLTISPDLLKFVSPEVTYVDAEGVIHTISGVKDLDSLVNINIAIAPGTGIVTKQIIKGTNYKCWNLNMYFKKSHFHSYMGVKYKKLDLIEDTTGVVYDFHHSIFSTTILAKSSTTTKYKWYSSSPTITFSSVGMVENHITLTKKCYYNGGEVENYINELVNTPDKVGFFIDEDDAFTENNDFDL